jgi:hypothetical protein
MPYLPDAAFDLALDYINDGTRLDITSQEVNTTGDRDTYTLGNKTSPTIGSPTNGATNGRRVIVSAISDGSVTANGTASHWAISNATIVQAAGALSSSQGVTSGNQFALGSFSITFPDAT